MFKHLTVQNNEQKSQKNERCGMACPRLNNDMNLTHLSKNKITAKISQAI
jgi:hypothetical protein